MLPPFPRFEREILPGSNSLPLSDRVLLEVAAGSWRIGNDADSVKLTPKERYGPERACRDPHEAERDNVHVLVGESLDPFPLKLRTERL